MRWTTLNYTKDLLRIDERALCRLLGGNSAAADLMDECAKFRTDIRQSGLVNPEQVRLAVKDAAFIFSR
jgi:hypothetical protein